MNPRCLFLLVLLAALQSVSAPTLANKLTVVSTIPPLAMLVEAIGGERVRQQVLLKENTSLHGYSLRPSDVKMLKSADIVFWVSSDLERFLGHLLEQSSPPLWQPGAPIQSKHSFVREPEDKSHNHKKGADFHVWLDPDKARVLAFEIAQRLGKKDPGGMDYFNSRLEQFNQKVEQVEQQIKVVIADQQTSITGKQWIIQHQAYSHLLAAYHLPEPLVFSLTPEQSPSLRELVHLKKSLMTHHNDEVCVILEPGLSDKPLQSLLQGRHYKTVQIDALGWKFNSYPQFLMATVRAWLYCDDTTAD